MTTTLSDMTMQPTPPPEQPLVGKRMPMQSDLLRKLRNDKDLHVKYLTWVMQQFTKCKAARIREERKWYMNLAFTFGQQNAVFIRAGSSGGSIGGTNLYVPPAPYYRSRPVTNLIRPAVRKEVSTLNSTKPSVSVIPATSDDRDLMAALAGEQIWESFYRTKKLKSKFSRALLWSVICGTSYLQSSWDDGALDTASDQYGDICFNVLTPFHILVPDLMEEELESQPYVIHQSAMDLEAAKLKYSPFIGNVNLMPNTTAAADIISDSFLSLLGAADAKRDNVLCIDIWIKPGVSKLMPKGGYLCIVGGQIIQAWESWPYNHGRYPFSKLDYISSGRYYGEGMVTDLVPLQREYNRTRGQIIEAKNRMAKPQLMAPRGSIEPSMITTEPGQVILYTPGFTPPTPIALTPLPAYVVQELEVIRNDIADISGQHDISSGKAPPGVTSATAISFLSEQDDSMRATAFDNLEGMVESVAFQTLSYVNQYWDASRIVKIVGDDGSFDTMAFKGSDLNNNTDVVVEAGSSLPTSKAAKQAFIMDLMKMNFLDPQKGMEVMDMGGISKIYEDIQIDVMQARRENLKMQAMTQENLSNYLETFVMTDPTTQQPVANYDPNTQQLLPPGEQPPPIVPVNTFDNHQVHIDTHNKYRKGQSFDSLSPENKQLFEQHVAMHQRALQAAMAPQPGMEPQQGQAPQGPPGGAIQGAGMTQNPLTQQEAV